MKYSHTFKPLLTGALTLACLTFGSAQARQDTRKHTDFAKVTHVSPIYEEIAHQRPRNDCRAQYQEQREHRRHRDQRVHNEHPRHHNNSATSTLVGGIIGGAIGHAVGHGKDNKKLGAAIGTVVGLSIGHDAGKRSHRRVSQHRDECRTRYSRRIENRLIGYNVKYRYHGRHYQTRMNQHPGRKIRVSVSVRPQH